MIESLSVGPLGERCYLLPFDGGQYCALVDPGDEGPRIVEALAAMGLLPAYIVLTHGHLDHVAAIPDIFAAFGNKVPGLFLACHEAESGYFGPSGEERNRSTFAAIRALGFFRSYWKPLPAASVLLKDGDSLPSDPEGHPSTWKVIHSPGHTQGSICLYDAGQGLLVSGDTLFLNGVGRTDCPDSSPEALRESLTRLCALPEGTRVFPGHGEATTIGEERAGLGLSFD